MSCVFDGGRGDAGTLRKKVERLRRERNSARTYVMRWLEKQGVPPSHFFVTNGFGADGDGSGEGSPDGDDGDATMHDEDFNFPDNVERLHRTRSTPGGGGGAAANGGGVYARAGTPVSTDLTAGPEHRVRLNV